MSQFLSLHPETPQTRHIQTAVDVLESGGVIVYPTDSGYALGCALGEKKAVDRIRAIRKLDHRHNFTLVCRDLSDIALYAKVDNVNYRLLKQSTPGPFTFILKATSEVPNRLMHPKRKTIGVRIPDNKIAMELLHVFNQPLMSVSLIMPNDDLPLTDAWEIKALLFNQVDLILDGGFCGMEPTTVVTLFNDQPEVIRHGLGDASLFE